MDCYLAGPWVCFLFSSVCGLHRTEAPKRYMVCSFPERLLKGFETRKGKSREIYAASGTIVRVRSDFQHLGTVSKTAARPETLCQGNNRRL